MNFPLLAGSFCRHWTAIVLKLPEKGVYSASTTVSLAMKLYISDSEPILLDQIRCYKLSCLVSCIVEHPCPSCNSISTCEAALSKLRLNLVLCAKHRLSKLWLNFVLCVEHSCPSCEPNLIPNHLSPKQPLPQQVTQPKFPAGFSIGE